MIMRRDMHSGGIVFDLTPEEKALEDAKKEIFTLRDELEKKNTEMDIKLKEVRKLLESSSK